MEMIGWKLKRLGFKWVYGIKKASRKIKIIIKQD